MFALENLFLIEGLNSHEKEKIIQSLSKPVKFKKYETIYSAENFSYALGFICNGKAFAVADNGFELYMNSFEKGSCFGSAALFGNTEKYVSNIVAQTNVEVLFITEEALKKIFIEFPQTAINYISFLSDKIRFLNKKLNLISCSTSEDTVLKYLTLNCDREGYVSYPKNMTRLCKILGISRSTLYRCIENLEANNKIVKKNNYYIKVIKNEKNC